MKKYIFILLALSSNFVKSQIDSIAVVKGHLPNGIFCKPNVDFTRYYNSGYLLTDYTRLPERVETLFDTLYYSSDSSLFSGKVFFDNGYKSEIRFRWSYSETTCNYKNGIKTTCTSVSSCAFSDGSIVPCRSTFYQYDSTGKSLLYMTGSDFTWHEYYDSTYFEDGKSICISTTFYDNDTMYFGKSIDGVADGSWIESARGINTEGDDTLFRIRSEYEDGYLADVKNENILYLGQNFEVVNKETFFSNLSWTKLGEFQFISMSTTPICITSDFDIILTSSSVEIIAKKDAKKIRRKYKRMKRHRDL